MKYNINFDIAALAMMLVLFLMFMIRRSIPTRARKIFFVMLISVAAASALDLVTAFMISFPDSVPLWVNYVANMMFLLAYNISNVIFYFYVLEVAFGSEKKKRQKMLGYVCAGVDIAVILTTPLTRLVIYFDEAGNYVHAPLFYLLYLTGVLLLIFDMVNFIVGRLRFSHSLRIAIIGNITLMLVVIVVQWLREDLLISGFTTTLMLMMVYSSLESPTEFFFRKTECYNDNAFYHLIEARLDGKKPFSVICVVPDVRNVMFGLLSTEAWDALVYHLISVLHDLFGKANVFYMHEGHFALTVEGDPQEAAERLLDHFRKHDKEDESDFTTTSRFLVLPCPEPFDSVAQIRPVIEFVFSHTENYTEKQFVVLEPREAKTLDREARVIRCVRNAVKDGSFEVYYQPIFNSASGKFETAEALVRLFDKDLGMIPPAEFIPLAERDGLIGAVGEIVFDRVCRFFRENELEKHGIRFVEVNLSAMQCMHSDLPARLLAILRKNGMDPSYINLEITETAAAANEKIMKKNMQELIAAGFAFSLDDYGTGYCNATYLSNLPVSLVKIDKSILWKAMEDERSKTVLSNTVSLVRELGMDCLTEGVEDKEMADLLISFGSPYHQGYYYSRPLPGEDYLNFITEHNA